VAAASVEVVGDPGDGAAGADVWGEVVVVGLGAVVRVVVGAGTVVEGSGIGGSGATAVSSRADPLAITNAITRPTTSMTATPASTHSQRGDFGGPGGG